MRNLNTKRKHKLVSYERRKGMWGFILLAPWIIGFLIFFLKPLIETIIYSFNEITLTKTGIKMSFVGIDNFINALTVHSTFNQELITLIVQAIPSTVMIIFFSMMASMLLIGEYRGRFLARAIFFLPIIMATDLISVSVGGATTQMIATAQADDTTGVLALAGFLIRNTNIPKEMITTILSLIGNIFSIITQSGVQILIFLAGLQAIAPSLYEVAKIEGATKYETFWKVTLPMVSPLILTCTIYTLTDSFMQSDLTDTMYDVAFKSSQYGLSAAMGVVFLAAALVIIGIASFLISRKVFYYD